MKFGPRLFAASLFFLTSFAVAETDVEIRARYENMKKDILWNLEAQNLVNEEARNCGWGSSAQNAGQLLRSHNVKGLVAVFQNSPQCLEAKTKIRIFKEVAEAHKRPLHALEPEKKTEGGLAGSEYAVRRYESHTIEDHPQGKRFFGGYGHPHYVNMGAGLEK